MKMWLILSFFGWFLAYFCRKLQVFKVLTDLASLVFLTCKALKASFITLPAFVHQAAYSCLLMNKMPANLLRCGWSMLHFYPPAEKQVGTHRG